jgi:hypothetical protein
VVTDAGKQLFHSETANSTADTADVDVIAYTAESALVVSHFHEFSD